MDNSPSPIPVKKSGKPIIAVIMVGAVVAALVYAVLMIGQQPSIPQKPDAVSELSDTTPSIPPFPSEPAVQGDGDDKAALLAQFGDSTEINAIEQDVRGTDLTGLDAEMAFMEKEVQ